MARIGEFSHDKFNRLEHHTQRLEDRLGYKRVRLNIDLDKVYMLARCMLSSDDMAVKLGISKRTYDRCLAEWPEFAARIIEGHSTTRQELSKVQLDMALSGNPTMLIWLGKQHLHQADKHEQNNRTEISITVQKAMDELRTIPRGQLLEAQALLERPALALPGQESGADPDAEGVGTPANEVTSTD